MDKTKSKLAAFFDNDDDDSSFPQMEVDDQKRSAFTQGKVRKSKREKEREAAEAKRKEEEENAAKAYAEFLDAFQGEEADRKKAGSTFVKAGESSTYTPAVRGKAASGLGMRGFEEEPMQLPSPPSAVPRPKGKRAMDHFLEEIKREQADREARLSRHATHGRSVTSIAAYEGQSGSKDRGDPESTNIFVANLPPHVTEQSLGTFFARCGPVGSVKIMWPRGDATHGPGADMTATRRTKNAGLSGFVSFMRRKDAEAALRELDGFDWGGSILRVGWSKAVPIAARPLYVLKKSSSHSRSRSRSRSRSPRNHSRERSRRRSFSLSRSHSRDQGRSGGHRSSRRSRSRSRGRDSRSPSPYRRRSTSRRRYGSRSQSPSQHSKSPRATHLGMDEEEVSDKFIRLVATEVKGHDAEYEHSLKEREKANPKYAFFRRDHRRNKYYRSLLDHHETLDLEFDDEGYNSVYSTDSAEESEREHGRKNELGKFARKRFEAMLRALSGKRGEIARCMAFSLEHAEAAAEVSDTIIASLVVDGTPVPRKVARLHLICDILHNSAAPLPMAWKFRQEFQSRLGLVFDHLSTIYHSFPGRITAETFKKQITAVVDLWEDWIVFPPDFTSGLRARLEGSTVREVTPKEEVKVIEVKQKTTTVSKFKAISFKPTEEVTKASEPAADSDEGEQMDLGSDDESKPFDDVDGAPMDADVDGEPMDDVDGVPMDDLDGEPLDDVDGEPMDGEPIDGEPTQDDIDGVPADINQY